MNDNNYNEDSHYAMGVSLMWKFAGDNIPQVGNLISHISIRMQMLIPQLNTEYFYRLSVVDSFNVDLVENDKYEILYNPKDSVTLLLIKKTKGDDDSLFEIYKESELEMDRLEALSFAIKKQEKKFEYTKMTLELNNQLNYEFQNKKNDIPNTKRVKI
jgi:hypothetical protein